MGQPSLCKCITLTCEYSDVGLRVKVSANSSMDVLRGRVGRVDLGFQKICFQQFYCSAGGHITIEGTVLCGQVSVYVRIYHVVALLLNMGRL